MIKNIVFDWSGTLLDDIECTFITTNSLLKHFDKPPITKQQYRQQFQIPVAKFYAKILPGISMSVIDQLFYRQYNDAIQQMPLFDYVENLLQLLIIRGCRLFVLSTLNSKLLESELKRRGLSTMIVYGSSSDKVADLKQLMSKHNCSTNDTIMIGDTEHDVQAGLVNKVKTIACCYGYSSTLIQQTKAAADFYTESTEQLLDYFDLLFLEQNIQLPLTTIGGLVIAKDTDNIALVLTDKWQGYWGTAGGKLQYGESLEQGFSREIKEELGLTIASIEPILVQESIDSPEFYQNRHFILHNYAGYIDKQIALQPNSEIIDCGWFNIEQALQLNINLPTKKLLQKFSELKTKVSTTLNHR